MRLQIAEIIVVLPAPLGPSRPKNSPSGTTRSTASSARKPSSYCLVSARSSRAGTAAIRVTVAPVAGEDGEVGGDAAGEACGMLRRAARRRAALGGSAARRAARLATRVHAMPLVPMV